jgi:hypothetical protein
MPKRTTLQHKKKLEDAKKSENSPTKWYSLWGS